MAARAGISTAIRHRQKCTRRWERRGEKGRPSKVKQVVTVIACLVKVKTKEELRKLLEWWMVDTMQWDWITAIVGPSVKHDPVLKLMSKIIKIVLVDPCCP